MTTWHGLCFHCDVDRRIFYGSSTVPTNTTLTPGKLIGFIEDFPMEIDNPHGTDQDTGVFSSIGRCLEKVVGAWMHFFPFGLKRPLLMEGLPIL